MVYKNGKEYNILKNIWVYEYISNNLKFHKNLRNSYSFNLLKWFLRIYIRNKSKTKKSNKSVVINHQRGIETNADTYTELGNTETEEPENQYDSISRQENHINMNVL